MASQAGACLGDGDSIPRAWAVGSEHAVDFRGDTDGCGGSGGSRDWFAADDCSEKLLVWNVDAVASRRFDYACWSSCYEVHRYGQSHCREWMHRTLSWRSALQLLSFSENEVQDL